jgi:hypothetical protein
MLSSGLLPIPVTGRTKMEAKGLGGLGYTVGALTVWEYRDKVVKNKIVQTICLFIYTLFNT